MFQQLRQNSQLYVLHKDNTPKVEIGYINSVSIPRAKYPVPQTFGQPQEMVVDITAKLGSTNVNYTGVPANLDLVDFFSNGENLVISDNKEAMNAEILNLKQKSIDIINSKEQHEELVRQYDNLLTELNPEFAEKQQQQEEINQLKTQMKDITNSLNDLMTTNKALLERLKQKEL